MFFFKKVKHWAKLFPEASSNLAQKKKKTQNISHLFEH